MIILVWSLFLLPTKQLEVGIKSRFDPGMTRPIIFMNHLTKISESNQIEESCQTHEEDQSAFFEKVSPIIGWSPNLTLATLAFSIVRGVDVKLPSS